MSSIGLSLPGFEGGASCEDDTLDSLGGMLVFLVVVKSVSMSVYGHLLLFDVEKSRRVQSTYLKCAPR
jgi:hypothetical protein